jgi:hypothetical protein
MANPNIVGVTAIYGKTAVQQVANTATAIVTNSSGSNKIFKVNALYVSNVDGTNAEEINVSVFRGSVSYHIVKTVAVPADSTLDVVSKPIYLEEGDELRLVAGSSLRLEAVCSYEEIS